MNDFLERQKEYLKLRQEIDAEISAVSVERKNEQNKIISATNAIKNDNERITNVITNAPAIIHDIHTQFEKATQLSGKDFLFLFGAAALQTARWAILPEMDWDFSKVSKENRLSAAQGGKIENAEIVERLKKEGLSTDQIKSAMEHNKINNYTWQKLLIAPVPYDAMKGSSRIVIPGLSEKGKNLSGMNHHAATWGHDPLWGYFFGTVNITTRTITLKDHFQTYHVAQVGNTFNQKITYQTSLVKTVPHAINIYSEDSKKLFASLAKQAIHQKSDKYTKLGLPIPFINSTKAQELLQKGWNSNEVERLFKKASKNLAIVGAQFTLAILIDSLVRGLHLLCYDESVDGNINIYTVKTNKMICYSNALAEVANGIYVISSRDVGKLDIGGYLNLAANLVNNSRFQNQVKAEFLEKELHKKLYDDNYYWEES